jgi:hypothetical protein
VADTTYGSSGVVSLVLKPLLTWLYPNRRWGATAVAAAPARNPGQPAPGPQGLTARSREKGGNAL